MLCQHCNLDTDQPAVAQIVELLREHSRRDIYEIGSRPGQFTISYPQGRKMPVFSREIAEAVAATGLVAEHPTCRGWFQRRAQCERPKGKPDCPHCQGRGVVVYTAGDSTREDRCGCTE